MPHATYRSLPLEALYELLESSIRDLLVASDFKADNKAAFNAVRKQIEVLLDLIEQKKKENLQKN